MEGVPRIEAWERKMAPAYRRALALLRERGVPAAARVLDAAAGYGFFLAAARDAGFDAHGVEPSAEGCRFAREWLGLRPACAAFEDWTGPDGAFDAVPAFHALERAPDPRAFLARARRLLRPGGVLLVHGRRMEFAPLLAGADFADLRVSAAPGVLNAVVHALSGGAGSLPGADRTVTALAAPGGT